MPVELVLAGEELEVEEEADEQEAVGEGADEEHAVEELEGG